MKMFNKVMLMGIILIGIAQVNAVTQNKVATKNSDGCNKSGQSCTCSNTGLKGTCNTGNDKAGLYCHCTNVVSTTGRHHGGMVMVRNVRAGD